MRYKNLKPGCHNHKTACVFLAEQFNVTPKEIDATLRVFLGGWGLQQQMKKGQKTSLAGLFLMNPTWLKQIRMAQKIAVKKKKGTMYRRRYEGFQRHKDRLARSYYRNDNMFKIYEFT